MNRRALLLGLVASACAERTPKLGFGRAALALARLAGELGAGDETWSIAELHRITTLARGELLRFPGQPAAEVLSRLLFDRLGFAREVSDTGLDYVLLSQVLSKRRGSCVGLSTLLLALADALDLTAFGVLLPGHFYVRWAGASGPRNVELLRRGEAMSDAWYRDRFPVPDDHPHEYARPLSAAEALGVIEYNVGNERRRQVRLDDAARAFAHSVQLFPEFAEAHASFGATLHVLGRLREARASYQRARENHPQLAGVDWNLELLRQDEQAQQTIR